MSSGNITDLYWQYFNHNRSYVLDYIKKFETQFKITKSYSNNIRRSNGFVINPNGLYRIYVSSENNLKDILQEFFIHIVDVNNKFYEFSDLIKDLIDKLTRERWPEREPYEDDCYFATDDDTRVDDDLSYFVNEHCNYVKPNSTEARMVIQWLILFKVCNNNSIDLEDINDFCFAFDKNKVELHLFIWSKNQSEPRHFIFESIDKKSILDISCWNEKEALPKLNTFALPLRTAVSEINKFKSNYTSIIVKGKTNITDFEDVFRDIFKIMVNNEAELITNLNYLEIDDNSEYTTSTKFENFATDLRSIIDNIIPDESERDTEWFFRSNNGHTEDFVSRFLNNPETKYYKPRILESRLAIAWIVVYKLCKKSDLDRTKIENLAFYYYPRKDFLRIVITIDGKDHKFGMPYAKENNVLDISWWHECTTCVVTGCLYINKDEEDDICTTYTDQDSGKESEEKSSDSKEEVKDESVGLTSFSDFLKKRLVDKWDNAIKNYVQIKGDNFQSDFDVHAVIPLDYIPKEEYNKVNELLINIYELSGQMPIFVAYPKDYCDNHISHVSFSRFDDYRLVDYGTIESTDTTSLMVILAALEYQWTTKKEVAEWDYVDHFIINKTTSDVFYKQGFARVRHSIINENNRIVEWYIPGSKDDININQSGFASFGFIDSLARIKPTEQKSDKRKKLLKLMLISQMINNSKK